MEPEQQTAGTEQAVPEIPVKAQTRDTMDGNGQPEEELPLAHAVDSHPAVQPKDYGIAAQAGTQSPVRTNMEELPEAFAKTLAAVSYTHLWPRWTGYHRKPLPLWRRR